jgi:predicted Fe-Mo cluster-binding NifX family protein
MKICIPSQDGLGLESRVHGHFGSAPWFTFVDTDSARVDVVENPACGHDPGSCHHVGMLSRRGVEMVFSAGMGRQALDGLADAGIVVATATRERVGDVVELARTGEVERFRFDAACAGGFHPERGHRHGHEHGGSCDHD